MYRRWALETLGQMIGQQFIDWLISSDGQKTIANYKIDGEQLFYPNA
jgi:tungstate transport system substrate-binding protein